MQYVYANITIVPFNEVAVDIISALLGEAGYDSFEQTEVGVKAYIKKEQFCESTLSNILSELFLPETNITYQIEELENKDWNELWEQEHFDPILEREYGIKLNPRMAFGSGSHETTYQITNLLFRMDFNGQRVLDMGTGTGVLGIAMAKKGAEEVVAIDIDEFSVENAKENFALNGYLEETSLESEENSMSCKKNNSKTKILLGDASSIEGTFDSIVANIHKNIIKADLNTYATHLKENGTIILSGFFCEDIPEIVNTASKYGLRLSITSEKNDWAVLVFKN